MKLNPWIQVLLEIEHCVWKKKIVEHKFQIPGLQKYDRVAFKKMFGCVLYKRNVSILPFKITFSICIKI